MLASLIEIATDGGFPFLGRSFNSWSQRGNAKR
jgi:hypothetical protein